MQLRLASAAVEEAEAEALLRPLSALAVGREGWVRGGGGVVTDRKVTVK